MRQVGHFLKKNWMMALGLTLSLGTILAFFLLTDGVTTLLEISRSLRYGWLMLAIALVILQWLFDAAGLHLLAVPHQPGRKFSQSFISAMIGVLYSALTPSATGGQPMMAISLSRQGMAGGTATSVVVVKTVLNQIAITLNALALVVWELPFFQAHVSSFSFIVLFAMFASVLFIAGLLLFTINQRLTRRMGQGLVRLLHKLHLCRDEQRLQAKVDAAFEQFFESTKSLGSSWRRCAAVVALSLVSLTCYFLVPYCLYCSFGFLGVSVVRLVAAATFVYFASMFVPVPGASGGAEGSFYLFFAPFFPAGAIAPAMLLWRLLTYYGAIVAGLLFAAMDKRHSALATPEAVPGVVSAPDSESAE